MAGERIVIVGAGPAGIRSAETLAAAGLRPLVVDEAARSGGQIYRRPPVGRAVDRKRLYGTEAGKALALHHRFEALSGRIDYRPDTCVWGIGGQRLFLDDGTYAEEIAFDRLILATGATDRLFPVPGWTLPGVYTLGAAQIALKAQNALVGPPLVFLGSGPLLLLVAWQYLRAGAQIAAVLDTARLADQISSLPYLAARPGVLAHGLKMRSMLWRAGVRVHQNVSPEAILGDTGGVTGVHWRDGHGRRHYAAANSVAMGWHLRPETQLAELAGCEMKFSALTRLWHPAVDSMGRSSRADVYTAGDGARIRGADAAEIAGRLAALALLEDLGHPPNTAAKRGLLRRRTRMMHFAKGLAKAFPWPSDLCRKLPDDTILCRCEAVTVGTFRAEIARVDALELNRAKAMSRVGMGRCQGRYCAAAAAEIMSDQRGCTLAETGRLRPQAPIKPLSAAIRTRSDSEVSKDAFQGTG